MRKLRVAGGVGEEARRRRMWEIEGEFRVELKGRGLE